jgi:outer membrane beta-barrel protein
MKTIEKGQGTRHRVFKDWGVQIGIITFAVVWLTIVAASWAESAELPPTESADTATRPENSDSDYNFNWLDPEKKIYVLQNRRYTKAGRAMLSFMLGPGTGNAYRSVLNFDPRISYHFSEAWGVEFFYTITSNSANSNYDSLHSTSPTISPFIREFKHEVGGMLEWDPWYAKINVFNSIIYFDWYFHLGAGSIASRTFSAVGNGTKPQENDENLVAVYWGTGHLYHLDEHWTARLDMTSADYHALSNSNGDKSWFSNYNFEIGLGYRF